MYESPENHAIPSNGQRSESGLLSITKLQKVVDEVYAEVKKVKGGKVASYIPELGKAAPELFGISVCDPHGKMVHAGDSSHPFTIQSISKVLTYACVLEVCEQEVIDKRVDAG
jgi:glutaminase